MTAAADSLQVQPIQRIGPLQGPWPLHDARSSRAVEQAALAAQPQPTLMEQAGLAVTRLALAMVPHGRSVQVWAGPGNNGGDGLVAARHLHCHGWQVRVHLLADPARLPADATQALRQAQQAGVSIIQTAAAVAPEPAPDFIIDALLGLGASRPPQGQLANAIAAINHGGAPVLAVDIPSGLHPDTGMPLGAAAVVAQATLALLTLKPGCLTGAGRDHAGVLWLAALGCVTGPPTAWLNAPPAPRPRLHAAHKGSFGNVAIVGGAPGMAGAAWLAARAASAAGAGRVYCSPLDPAAPLLDPLRPELMGRHAWWQSTPAQLADTTVACGCGGGDAVRQALPPLLSQVRRLVLDADALNTIANDAALQPLLRQRAARGLHTLLTPHPLEAARLLQSSVANVQQDRLQAASRLADRYGCAVLLKGSGSIVAAPDRLPVVNATGNAALATAGTGDVLAGWAAGRWAQEPDAQAADVASAAAWQHGRAADLWLDTRCTGPLLASDLVDALLRGEAAGHGAAA